MSASRLRAITLAGAGVLLFTAVLRAQLRPPWALKTELIEAAVGQLR